MYRSSHIRFGTSSSSSFFQILGNDTAGDQEVMLNAFGYALKYLDQNHGTIAKMGKVTGTKIRNMK
jgi:hypothetical protein